MGFFDFIFGRKSSEDADGQPSSGGAASSGPMPWPARLAQAKRSEDFGWDWGNVHAHRVTHSILEDAAPLFGTAERPAKIKELPDDENIDLRGTCEGSPIRFAVWMSFGSFWTIELRVDGVGASFELERDEEKVPKHGDDDDPFAEDDGLRVFVGKAIFVEGSERTVAEKLAVWEAIPEPLQETILAEMAALDARRVDARGNAITLNQRPGLNELDDPVAYMRRCAAFLVALRDGLPSAPIGASASSDTTAVPPVAHVRISCAYCSSKFLQTPSHQNCPNCGAAPQ